MLYFEVMFQWFWYTPMHPPSLKFWQLLGQYGSHRHFPILPLRIFLSKFFCYILVLQKITPSERISQSSLGPVLMTCWRPQLFCKSYNFICNMWCVMHDLWCSRLDFFVRSWLYESRGDQKHPIWVISDLFNDIPKLIPGGSRMYTISCKAS